MRIHYLSDLHLEAQTFERRLPKGELLLIAGDLCHARCLDPARTDPYCIAQRARVHHFVDTATRNFGHVVLIAGNHEHYDGYYDETIGLLRHHLPGITVLDDSVVDIGGVRIFGSTWWTDFNGRNPAAMDAVRKRMGEFFFVKLRAGTAGERPQRFQPEHALAAHDAARTALHTALAAPEPCPLVVLTHHAPSRHGLNPRFAGNDLDAAYASDLDHLIAGLDRVPLWVHGHTHVATRYRIGRTEIRSNALGFAAKGHAAAGFDPNAAFELPVVDAQNM